MSGTRSKIVRRPCGSERVVRTPAGLFITSQAVAVCATMGCPSTAMRSCSGSTLCPVRAGVPLTVTRPAITSDSAARRDATPARARARWMRIAGIASLRRVRRRGVGGRDHPERDRELVGPRQLLEVPKREVLEEERRRSVQQRPPQSLRPANDVDQTALVQRLEDAADRDTPDLLDVGARDRLSIGDDRQRLERGTGEPLRTSRELGALDHLGVFGAGEDLPPAGDLEQLDTMPLDVVMLPDLVERGGYGSGARVVVKRGELLRRDWTAAREQRRLKQLR